MADDVDLDAILNKEFPELSVRDPALSTTSSIYDLELVLALRHIKEHEMIQDAQRLLFSDDQLRTSVSYLITNDQHRRELTFRVDYDHIKKRYNGYIETTSADGAPVIQVELHGLLLTSTVLS